MYLFGVIGFLLIYNAFVLALFLEDTSAFGNTLMTLIHKHLGAYGNSLRF